MEEFLKALLDGIEEPRRPSGRIDEPIVMWLHLAIAIAIGLLGVWIAP